MGQINIGGTKAVQLQGYTDSSITTDQAFTFPPQGGQLVCSQQGSFNASIRAGSTIWVDKGVVNSGDYAFFQYWRIGQIVTINALFKFGSLTVADADKENTIYISDLPYKTKPNDTGSSFISWAGTQLWFNLTNGFDASVVQFFSYNYTENTGVNFIRSAYVGPGGGTLSYVKGKSIQSGTQTNLQWTYQTDDTTWVPNS